MSKPVTRGLVKRPVRRQTPVQAPIQTQIQAKLSVGPVNDRFEREADHVAAGVGSNRAQESAPPPVISPLLVSAPAGAQRMGRPSGPESTSVREEESLGEAVAQRMRASGPETPREEPSEDVVPLAQREAAPGGAVGAASAGVEQAISRQRAGPAASLPGAARSQLEGHLGVDLGGVRIHRDRAANQAADALSARAFTVGQDVFFARGQFNPASADGMRLLAHEATHTVQQRGGSAAAQRVQRAPSAKKTADDQSSITSSDSTSTADQDLPAQTLLVISVPGKGWAVDFRQVGSHRGRFVLPALELPHFAGALKGASGGGNAPVPEAARQLPVESQPFSLAPIENEREGNAYQVWLKFAEAHYADDIEAALTKRVAAQKSAFAVRRDGEDVYVLRSGGASASKAANLQVGTIAELSRSDPVLRPMLGPGGGAARLDADHILELQLGGADAAENMWLLQSSANRSVGSAINHRINKAILEVRHAAEVQIAKEKKANPSIQIPALPPADGARIRDSWVLEFRKVKRGKFNDRSRTHWSKKQIEGGEHLKHYTVLSEEELVHQGFLFKKGEAPQFINVFPTAAGGRRVRLDVNQDGTKLRASKRFFRGLEMMEDAPFTSPTKTGDTVISRLKVRKIKRKKGEDPLASPAQLVDLRHDSRLGFGAYITRDSLSAAFRNATFAPLSPVTFASAELTADGAMHAEGDIASSKKLLPKLHVPIIWHGDEIFIAFPIPADRLRLGPVQVTEAALRMGVDEDGFFIAGLAGVLVAGLGQGTLTARKKKGDVVIAGTLSLDALTFLDEAEVAASYSLRTDDFSAAGKFKVGKGKLPGVESGTIEVAASRDSLGISGSLMLGGLLKGSIVTVSYLPERGLVIEGKDLPLPVSKLPGVTDAKVSVRASRSPDSGDWSITGGGKAGFAAVGATGSMWITYDGESVFFLGRASVAKGPATGWLMVSATNRAIDDEGKPIEGAPIGELKIWGKGEATIVFGDVLEGTAGLEYTPDGRVIINGEIAVRDKFEVFGRQPYDVPIFTLPRIFFTIWGFKLGPVGLRVAAFVDGGLEFNSYFGPGELRDTRVKALMDLDKPEEATVDGTARFHVPAFAGLTIDIGGGLQLDAGPGFARGRVGLEGALGLHQDFTSGIDVHWSKATGLTASTFVDVSASPSFVVSVTAELTAGVDLYFKTLSKKWGPWKKELGRLGPGFEVGATVPIAWSEKSGLDFDPRKIDFKRPKLSGGVAASMMKDGFRKVIG